MIELTDADHIRNLLGSYARSIDAGDFAAVGDLFAHGALAAEHGDPFAVGAEAVRAFFEAGTRLHGVRPGTTHLVTNTTFVEPDDPSGAAAHSTYLVLQATPDLPLQPIVTGRYHDQFARVDGRWCFALRRFVVDQVGDLAHHLRDPRVAEP